MRKLLAIVVVVLLPLGFYVLWPAYSGWQIKTALDGRDSAMLGRKIDFPGVRSSLQPVVTGEVQKRMDQALADLGPGAALLGPRFKEEFAPKIADNVLASMVTPETIIRIAAEGGSIKQAVEKVMREQLGKMQVPGANSAAGVGTGTGGGLRLPGGLGGLLGAAGGATGQPGGLDLGKVLGGLGGGKPEPKPAAPASAPAAPAAQAKPSFGLGNIKRLAPTGLASFEIGVARDATAPEPELTVGMAFTGGDWKVVSVRPKL